MGNQEGTDKENSKLRRRWRDDPQCRKVFIVDLFPAHWDSIPSSCRGTWLGRSKVSTQRWKIQGEMAAYWAGGTDSKGSPSCYKTV